MIKLFQEDILKTEKKLKGLKNSLNELKEEDDKK